MHELILLLLLMKGFHLLDLTGVLFCLIKLNTLSSLGYYQNKSGNFAEVSKFRRLCLKCCFPLRKSDMSLETLRMA